jgi:membrane protease YdiL (CAAX protease family)
MLLMEKNAAATTMLRPGVEWRVNVNGTQRMSIVGQASSVHGAGWTDLLILLTLLAVGAGSVLTAVWAGVFRRGSIAGPGRVSGREPLAMLLLVLGIAFFLWFLCQVALLVPQVGGAAGSHSSTSTTAATLPGTTLPATTPVDSPSGTIARLSPRQMALLSSVPPLIAFAFMIVANRTIRRQGLEELGFSPRRLWPGIKSGLVGSVIAVPLVFLAAQVTEFVWQAIHYSHPAEHDLLRVLGESHSRWVAAALIASAILIAPLFEEALFRAHLQTLLTYAWGRLHPTGAAAVADGSEMMQRGFDVVQPGPLMEPPPATAPAPRQPAIWARWISVLLTSTFFSLVHPAWSIPPIFVLSVCLGYAYERTGNVWTNITMHAVFNSVSTALFLSFMR